MKKSIYISGIASANLMMFGTLFKVMHWPGAGILLTLATFLFCFHFLPFALLSSYKEPDQKKYKPLYIVTFIVFFIGIIGILFKVQHWPGAGIFLLVGVPLPFVLFLPVYLYQTRNDDKNDTFNFSGIMFGLIFLAVFSVLLSLNVSKNIFNTIEANIQNNTNAANYTHSIAKNFTEKSSAKQKSDELCAYIERLKNEFLHSSGNNSSGNPSQIIRQKTSDIRVHFQDDVINDLKLKMNAYRESLVASGKMTPELTGLIKALFDVSDKISVSSGEAVILSWEQREFSDYKLILVVDVLTQIQSNVRLVESEMLALES